MGSSSPPSLKCLILSTRLKGPLTVSLEPLPVLLPPPPLSPRSPPFHTRLLPSLTHHDRSETVKDDTLKPVQ